MRLTGRGLECYVLHGVRGRERRSLDLQVADIDMGTVLRSKM